MNEIFFFGAALGSGWFGVVEVPPSPTAGPIGVKSGETGIGEV